MNQGTGWAAVLKRAVYARMEELSFRSAVATAAGVLAITGAGVTLTVTSGGSQQLAIAPPAVSGGRGPEYGGALVARRVLACGRARTVGQPCPCGAGSRVPAGDAGPPPARDDSSGGVIACFPGHLLPWADAASRRRGAVAVAPLVPARLAPGLPAPAADG